MRAFADESARARAAFEAEIRAYDARLSESSRELSATHAGEIERLVAEHAAALSAAVAEKASAEDDAAAARAEYEATLASTLERHAAETEAASEKARAALDDAARAADESLASLRDETDAARAELVAELEAQRAALEGEKNALSVELDATSAELTQFLKLRAREDAVAEQVASLEKAYAEALRIESAGLDPEDAKQREALEKVGETVAREQRAAIPTWAYYAVGVATALLPRLFGGAL